MNGILTFILVARDNRTLTSPNYVNIKAAEYSLLNALAFGVRAT